MTACAPDQEALPLPDFFGPEKVGRAWRAPCQAHAASAGAKPFTFAHPFFNTPKSLGSWSAGVHVHRRQPVDNRQTDLSLYQGTLSRGALENGYPLSLNRASVEVNETLDLE